MKSYKIIVLLIVGLPVHHASGQTAPPTNPDAESHATDEASATFADGRQLMSERRYDEACPLFARSFSLHPTVGAALNEARCRELQGKTATAWSLYRRAQTLAARQGDTEREKLAAGAVDELALRLATVTIQIAADQDIQGMRIEVNGNDVSPQRWNRPVKIDPGRHKLEVKVDEQTTWRDTFEVPDAEHITVTIPTHSYQRPESGKPATSSDQEHRASGPSFAVRWNLHRNGPLVVLGAATVAMAVGGTLGFKARQRWQDATSACEMLPDQCTPRAVTYGLEARSRANQSTWLVAGGTALVAVGALWWWTTRAERQAARISRSRAVIVPTLSPDAAGAVVYTQF